MKKRVIAITGPTATGKTDTALLLAERMTGQIICMDSMQIYRKMDIGTAKPTISERSRCPHYLFDRIDPRESYSAAQYAQDVFPLLDTLSVPIMTGGTGLYLNAVSKPMSFGNHEGAPAIREKYEQLASDMGKEYVHAQLEKVDPVSAQRLHVNDLRRVIRALEVYESTGSPISSQTNESKPDEIYDFRIFAFCMDRELLYERINLRVDRMMAAGLPDEVAALLASGVPTAAQSMQGIGYKELIPVLNGKCSLNDAVDLIKQKSRNYAKRQMTWFRRDERIHWINMNHISPFEAAGLIMDELNCKGNE